MTRTNYGWLQYTATFPAGTRYVAIKWADGYPFYIDDITFTRPTCTYAEWAAASGITGAWNATDALGVHNVFRYAFDVPEGPVTNPPLLSIVFGAGGTPVVLTPPLVNGEGFALSILATEDVAGSSNAVDYALAPSGTNAIPASAAPSRFFRLKAEER